MSHVRVRVTRHEIRILGTGGLGSLRGIEEGSDDSSDCQAGHIDGGILIDAISGPSARYCAGQ